MNSGYRELIFRYREFERISEIQLPISRNQFPISGNQPNFALWAFHTLVLSSGARAGLNKHSSIHFCVCPSVRLSVSVECFTPTNYELMVGSWWNVYIVMMLINPLNKTTLSKTKQTVHTWTLLRAYVAISTQSNWYFNRPYTNKLSAMY